MMINNELINSGISIGKELHKLFMEEDDLEVIHKKQKELISISENLAKEILDTIISKDREIIKFLGAESTNCKTRAINCHTVGELISKNLSQILVRFYQDHVTTISAWFDSSFCTYYLKFKKQEEYISFIEKTVYEMYGERIKIKFYKLELKKFELYFSWY